jgi:NADH dehydrogenase
MRIAITGGTGFVGGHLARKLLRDGHEVVSVSRNASGNQSGAATKCVSADLSDAAVLAEAFAGCDAVAHCAGINRELGRQTFARVHIEGTKNVVWASRQAQVKKIVFMSFLRARPDRRSSYHESKWAAEEIIRASGLNYTVVKAGMVYGRGDHMLDHLSHALHTFPFFAMVGLREKSIRPLAIEDLVQLLSSALIDERLSQRTVAITGPEELYLSEAVRRVARVTGNRVRMFPAPVWSHYLLATLWELTMKVPLAARAQIRILSEGVAQPAAGGDPLPADLAPKLWFTDEQIRKGLPEPGPFTARDLRCCYA